MDRCPAASTNMPPPRPIGLGGGFYFLIRLERDVNYKTTNQLSSANAGYIAGLIDGEGTIALTRKHSTDNRQLGISISSTDRPMLEFVQEITGVGKVTNKKTYRDHHLPSYTYAVYNRQALTLLRQIAPLLRTYKSARAKLILDNYVALTPRNGKYTTELASRREEFIEEVMNIKA